MANKFSRQVKDIISFARDEAMRLGNDSIAPEHFVLAILKEGNNNAIRILESFNLDMSELKNSVELSIYSKTAVQQNSTLKVSRYGIFKFQSLPLNKKAERIVHQMVLEATALKSEKIEPEHLMLAILKNNEDPVSGILNYYNVDYNKAVAMCELPPVHE